MTPPTIYLQSVHPLSEACKNALESVVQFQEVHRKEHLLTNGLVCRNIYFVEKGQLRVYYHADYKEISSSFAFEGQLCFAPESFFSQRAGIKNIVAMEASVVWYISFEQYKALTASFPEFNVVCRLLLEQCERLREERLLAMIGHSVQDRFEWFMERDPALLTRVPAKHLSSYLGMNEASFSNSKSRFLRVAGHPPAG